MTVIAIDLSSGGGIADKSWHAKQMDFLRLILLPNEPCYSNNVELSPVTVH